VFTVRIIRNPLLQSADLLIVKVGGSYSYPLSFKELKFCMFVSHTELISTTALGAQC